MTSRINDGRFANSRHPRPSEPHTSPIPTDDTFGQTSASESPNRLTLELCNYICNIAPMNDQSAVIALSALAHGDRLAAFRMLVRAGPDGMPSGEIAERLSIPPTRMSFHLATLERSGLVRSWRDGRRILYAASYDDMREFLAFLTEDCCGGNPAICGDLTSVASPSCTVETCS